MTLSDYDAYRSVIGCLMKKPLLLLEYTDIKPIDFDYKAARVCFNAINKLYQAGATALTVLEIDQEIMRYGGASELEYKNGNGLDFLKEAYIQGQEATFEIFYNRLKKCSLLRRLQKAHYDISEFYIDSKTNFSPFILYSANIYLDIYINFYFINFLHLTIFIILINNLFIFL